MLLLPKIFWTKREEVTEGWRKFHNELHDFCFLLNTISIHLNNRMKPKTFVSLSLPLPHECCSWCNGMHASMLTSLDIRLCSVVLTDAK